MPAKCDIGLYSIMDIAILGSDEGDDLDMGGITGGVRGVA